MVCVCLKPSLQLFIKRHAEQSGNNWKVTEPLSISIGSIRLDHFGSAVGRRVCGALARQSDQSNLAEAYSNGSLVALLIAVADRRLMAGQPAQLGVDKFGNKLGSTCKMIAPSYVS